MGWFYALRNRMRELLPVGTCKAQVIFLKEAPTTNGLDAARRGDVGALDLIPRHYITCPKMYDRCQRCAGFQAYRQVFSVCQKRAKDLAMALSAEQVKADVRDGELESAEVDRVDHQRATANGIDAVRHADSQTHTVL